MFFARKSPISMDLFEAFRKFFGCQRKHYPNEESADICKKVQPLPIAIDMGLYEFYEAAVKSKTDQNDLPLLWFAKRSRKGKSCICNEMMGFV